MADSGKKVGALEKAMRILGARACSEQELRRKLRTAGYSAGETAEAVERCRKLGFLNDRLLAEDYARSLSERGCGARLARFRLRRRGLGSVCVEAALEETSGEEPEACRRALEGKLRTLARESDPRRKREKAFRFLAGRGFSADLIREVFDETDFSGGTTKECDDENSAD